MEAIDKKIRFDAIDGLRAIAILSVIAFHFDLSIAPAGFVGVDIFFVISGYVIALSLSKHQYKSKLNFILEFYKRRIIRIMPALLVMVIAVYIISALFIPESWLSSANNRTGLSSIFGLSNFALLSNSDGYFNSRVEFNPFLHTWSLAVEEQFYLFFPILFLPWLLYKNFNGKKHFLSLNLVLIIAIISLGWSMYESLKSPQLAFYMLPSRFWELASGAILFQLHYSGYLIPKKRFLFQTSTILGFGFIFSGIFFADYNHFPFPWALLPVIGTMALISVSRSTIANDSYSLSLLKVPLVVYIGKSSYSLYLWHWPVVVIMSWTIGFNSNVHITIAFLITFSIGLLSYHYVEKTFLNSTYLKNLSPAKIARNGLIVFISITVSLYLLITPKLSLSKVSQDPAWQASKLPTLITDSQDLSAYQNTIWVIGDSHSGAYRGMVGYTANMLKMRMKIKKVSGCPVANLRSSSNAKFCGNRFEQLIKDLKSNYKPGDIIFLASLRGQRLSDQWGMYEEERINSILNNEDSDKYKNALLEAENIIRELTLIGYTVIIDKPKPVFKAPPFRCADWFNENNPVCSPGFEVSAAALKSIDTNVLNNIESLQKTFPELQVWDPFKILCPGETCKAFLDAKPLFFDQDHLSGYGNELLIPSFLELIEKIKITNKVSDE